MEVFKELEVSAMPQEFLDENYKAVNGLTDLDIIVQRQGFAFDSLNKKSGDMPLKDLDTGSDAKKYKEYVDNYQNQAKYVDWHDGSKRRICTIKRYPFSKELINWVRTNLYPNINNIQDRQIGHQVWFGGEAIWPHTDGIRNYLLYYLTDEGGDEVKTSWWRKKDTQELVLKPATHFFNFNNLEEYKSVRVPIGTWVIMDTRVLHAVEMISRPRTSLSIGLLEHELESLLKHLNIKFINS